MLKLLGFVVGTALSMILFMGLANDATVDEIRSFGERLREHSAELITGIRQATQRPQGAPAVQILSPPFVPPTDVAISEAPLGGGEPHGTESSNTPSPSADTAPSALGSAWHSVWLPFRSEFSARGFAKRLANVTGREYRVRRVSPWAYQVELAYVSEADKLTALQQIETSTGLGVGGGVP